MTKLNCIIYFTEHIGEDSDRVVSKTLHVCFPQPNENHMNMDSDLVNHCTNLFSSPSVLICNF